MTTARLLGLAASLLCLASAGCRRPSPHESGSAPSAQASSVSSGAVGSAPAPAAPAPSAPAPPPARAAHAAPSASAPPSAEELATLKRYGAALGKGRLLTTRKDFPGAIGAFDEALAAMPNDARALAERGYAKLQADDLDGAERDFYDALGRKPDPKAVSQITFNLAQVAERRGQGALADELKEAARSHRAPGREGKPSCSYQVKRGKDISLLERPERVLTLREARAKIASRDTFGGPTLSAAVLAPTEEEAIKRVLVGEGPPPWKIELGGSIHLVTGSPGDYRLLLEAASTRFARCGSTRSLRVDLAPLPSATSFYFDLGYGISCPKENLPPEQYAELCHPGCMGPSWYSLETTVFDPATLEPLLYLEHGDSGVSDDARSSVAFVVKENGVQIVGGGCNAFEPLTK